MSLWLTLRPKRLPIPLSGITTCVVYHPPGRPAESHKELNDYLINTTDRLRNEHPDHGLVWFFPAISTISIVVTWFPITV